MWDKEQILKIARDSRVVVGASCAISMGAGVVLGSHLTKLKMEKILEQEIAEVKEVYARRATAEVVDDKPDLSSVVESLGYVPADKAYVNDIDSDPDLDAAIDEAYAEKEEESEEEVVAAPANIFDLDGWNHDAELEWRADNPEKPWVIHHDEFMANDPDYEQLSLTYYAGDQVLVDHRDQPVENVGKLIGDGPLDQFGHGSNDENVVFVRNNNLELDFEIAKSTGKYAHEVLGFEEELRHSDNRRPGKFKNWAD